MAVMSNFEDLHDVAGVNEKGQREANEFPVAPTGLYNAQINKITRVVGEEGRWDEGLEYCRMSAPLVVAGEEEGTVKTLGWANFNVSWNDYRTPDGKQESMTRLYHQLTAALTSIGAINGTSTVADVMAAIIENPIQLSVTKSYRTDEGWRTIGKNTPVDTEVEYRKAGFEPRNFVQRILAYEG